eukprot:gene5874-biopygen4874
MHVRWYGHKIKGKPTLPRVEEPPILKFFPEICCVGGFVCQRHDETRDLFAHLMKEVYNDVKAELHLQPITGESLPSSANVFLEAHLDVSARGFWQRGQLAFFDVRVINPFAKSHLSQNLSTAFSRSVNTIKGSSV